MENILAIDIGGTFVKFAVIDEAGNIKKREKSETPKSLNQLMTLIEVNVKEVEEYAIAGLAISSPGSVSKQGIIYGASAIPYIHGPNLKEALEERTQKRVEIENDANCAALAEIWQGSAKGKKEVAVIVIGTGIGGALVHQGSIVQGHQLHGGEFGYMILDPNQLGSGMSTFSELASSYSIIKRVANKKNVAPSTLTGEEIFILAEEGDKDCIESIESFYEMLALGIYNIQYAYDPELILIGGGISTRQHLIHNIKEKLQVIVESVDVATIVPSIDICHFNENANLIGAVYHYLQTEVRA
ncbi:MAG TPA: ROK family protein [Pseudogracilibacillus sp.]|nr:ROK family protein [Pseudogracilibacillus sp.]